MKVRADFGWRACIDSTDRARARHLCPSAHPLVPRPRVRAFCVKLRAAFLWVIRFEWPSHARGQLLSLGGNVLLLDRPRVYVVLDSELCVGLGIFYCYSVVGVEYTLQLI